MEPHVQRMVEERDQLEERMNKATDFTRTDTFAALELMDRDLLNSQIVSMSAYLSTLNVRIARATGEA